MRTELKMSQGTKPGLYEFGDPEAFERLHDMQMSLPPHSAIAAEMGKALIPAIEAMLNIAHRRLKEARDPDITVADVAMANVMMARMLLINLMANTISRDASDMMKKQVSDFLSTTYGEYIDSAYDAIEAKEREQDKHG
jgi:hypothetical protein